MSTRSAHAAAAAVAPMSGARQLTLSAFLLLTLAAHLYDIAFGAEHWPVSSYRMYAEVYRPEVRRKLIVGVTDAGRELPLEVNTHLSPFDNTRLHWALERVLRERGPGAYRQALGFLLAHYERLRLERRHRGPAIVALRSYAARWRLEPDAGNRARPRRRLQFEATADGRALPEVAR
jgi:hypothetical protein